METRIHITQFKHRLLSLLDITAYIDKKKVILVLDCDIVLTTATEKNYDDERYV